MFIETVYRNQLVAWFYCEVKTDIKWIIYNDRSHQLLSYYLPSGGKGGRIWSSIGCGGGTSGRREGSTGKPGLTGNSKTTAGDFGGVTSSTIFFFTWFSIFFAFATVLSIESKMCCD